MKYFLLIILFGFLSCGDKETVQLPQSDISIVENVDDLSPVYIFFKVNGSDTIADLNRKNTIISTNWVFNIDKRLPLKLVIPEVMKLQDKKRNDSAHKNELAQNYFTYADSIKKNLAFLPFTEVYYKIGKPMSSFKVFFDKKNKIYVDGFSGKRDELKSFLNSLPKDMIGIIHFCFSKDLDYGSYIQDKIFIESLNLKGKSEEEFVY